MSRETYVRKQRDAMQFAIDAHARGDSKSFHEATNEIVRAGKALGSKAETAENPKLFEAKKPPVGTPKRRPKGRIIVTM